MGASSNRRSAIGRYDAKSDIIVKDDIRRVEPACAVNGSTIFRIKGMYLHAVFRLGDLI